jgi:hypothetical protein
MKHFLKRSGGHCGRMTQTHGEILLKGVRIMMGKIVKRTDIVSIFYISSICLSILAVIVWLKHIIDFRLVFALFLMAAGTFLMGRALDFGEEEKDENEYDDDEEDW